MNTEKYKNTFYCRRFIFDVATASAAHKKGDLIFLGSATFIFY